MTNILILTGLVIIAALVTAVMVFLDRPRSRYREIGSAELIQALKERK